jgi:hypothetical protein
MSKKAERLNSLVESSAMSIHGSRDAKGFRWILIRITGTLAKLPSTTNSRLLFVRGTRACLIKNPDHQMQLAALRTLWDVARGGHDFRFGFDNAQRGLVLMALSAKMNRMDSHNIPKATCDWLEGLSVFPNDRYVDAFARRKTDLGLPPDGTDILVVRYDALPSQGQEYFSQMQRLVTRIEERQSAS